MSSNIYVPVTETTLKSISSSKGPLALDPHLAISEAICLSALQALPVDHPAPGKLIEYGLERLFTLWNTHYLEGTQDIFREQLLGLLDQGDLKVRIEQMSRWNIYPVLPETIKNREFLTPRGEWDLRFKENYKGDKFASSLVRGLEGDTGYLTTSQFRIVERTSANFDEPLNIHGHAGTGKTRLLPHFLEILASQYVRPSSVLILSLSVTQLNALQNKIPAEYHGQKITFGNLARRILPQDYWEHTYPNRNKGTVNYNDLIEYYNIQPIARMGAFEIASSITMTVFFFCQSDSSAIGPEHLSRILQKRTYGGWQENQVLRELVLKTARDLWSKVFDLGFRDFFIPARDYHQVKFAALTRRTISPKYTHIIIDESHDLTAAMNQLLANSPHCTIIRLGDGYQNLRGDYIDVSQDIKTLDLGRSFRSGRALEEIIVPITNRHTFTPPIPYHGSPDIHTEVTYYRKPELPEKPTGILVSDHWAIWEWILRIAEHKQKFSLIGNSLDLGSFIRDVFSLKNEGKKPKHWSLSQYYTWDDLVSDMLPKNISFKYIFEMIDRGSTQLTFLQAMATSYVSDYHIDDQQTYHVIGRADSSRNHEFERIFLTPDMVSLTEENSKNNVRNIVQRSILYVTVSRGRFEVQAPVGIKEWIEEISG